MWPRYFIASMAILIAAMVATLIAESTSFIILFQVGDWLLSGSLLMAGYYLFHFGRLRRSRWRPFVFLFIALYPIMALTKIQHWPVANILVLILYGGIALFYIVWFLTKRNKWSNDYLKLLAVVTYAVLSLMRIMHWTIYPKEWAWLLILLTAQSAYIQFYISQRKHLAAERNPPTDYSRTDG